MNKLFRAFFIISLIFNISYSASLPPEITDLQNHYSGTIEWNATSKTITFKTSGEINFGGETGFIWKVPTYVKNIVINKNTTVNGAFHTYSDCTIKGQDRKTSIVYGTDEQRWADNRGILPYEICTFQNFGGVLTIKNLTSKNPRGYHVRGWGTIIHASYCDFIDNRGGWYNHSDGFCGGDGSTVDHCYFETGDDIIKVYFDITVTNSKIKMIQNTVPIQFGWGNYGSGAHGIFENDTIIGDWGRGSYRPIISAAGGTYTKYLTMKNCFIQNHTSALFELENNANINLTCIIENSFIDVKQFSSQFNGTKKIIINGENVNNGTTKHYWPYPTTQNKLPKIKFITPSQDTTILTGNSLAIEVEANDEDGTIKQVDLYINDQYIRSEKKTPYLWNDNGQDSLLNNMKEGTYILKAVAIDDKGKTSQTEIKITVKNIEKFKFNLNITPSIIINDSTYPIITYDLPNIDTLKVVFIIFQNYQEIIRFNDNNASSGKNIEKFKKIDKIGNGYFVLKLEVNNNIVDSIPFTKEVTSLRELNDFGKKLLAIYPNPVVKNVNININHEGTIYLYNYRGELITEGQENIKNYLSHSEKGIYFIILKYKGEIIAKQTITKI